MTSFLELKTKPLVSPFPAKETFKNSLAFDLFRVRFEIWGQVSLNLVYDWLYGFLTPRRWIPDWSIRERRCFRTSAAFGRNSPQCEASKFSAA